MTLSEADQSVIAHGHLAATPPANSPFVRSALSLRIYCGMAVPAMLRRMGVPPMLCFCAKNAWPERPCHENTWAGRPCHEKFSGSVRTLQALRFIDGFKESVNFAPGSCRLGLQQQVRPHYRRDADVGAEGADGVDAGWTDERILRGGEGAGERLGDEDEVFAGGELSVDQGEQIVIRERFVRGIRDDARGLTGWDDGEQRAEKVAGAVETGEEDEG